MAPIHTPIGTMGSIGGTPMDVMPSNAMYSGGMQEEPMIMPQVPVEVIEDLRLKYKPDIEQLGVSY